MDCIDLTESPPAKENIKNCESPPAVRKREKRVPQFQMPHHVKNLFFHKPFYQKYLDPTAHKQLHLIHENPNIYLVNNFLLESEIQYFDETITENFADFQNSFTEDNEEDKIYSMERTSRFFFLTKGKDRIVRNIESRAADLVGLPVLNVEPLQVLHYTSSQQFTTHHDAGTLLEDSQSIECILPRRLITLVVYLNNLPFGNGFTEFPLLKLSVLPRRGQALLFCNILPSGEADFRVIHKANPVHSPLHKYGMNIWISEKPMPMEMMEMHRKVKKRKADEVAGKNSVKKTRLQVAEGTTLEFCSKHFPAKEEVLYFQPEEEEATQITGKESRSAVFSKSNQVLEKLVPTGKNFFFNLNSFAEFDVHEKELIQKILENNKLSLPLATAIPSSEKDTVKSSQESSLYFQEESEVAAVPKVVEEVVESYFDLTAEDDSKKDSKV